MPPKQGQQLGRQSFIPRKATRSEERKKRGGSGIYFTASLIIFIITALATVGTYLYEEFLERRIEAQAISLERAQAAFEPALIRELKRVSARLNTANTLLDNHVALSMLFRHLGEKTLKTVRFSQFSYSLEGEAPVITMSGIGQSYSSVALQSDVFGADQFIRNPIFSNLGLDSAGNVTFNVRATVDPSLMLYSQIVE